MSLGVRVVEGKVQGASVPGRWKTGFLRRMLWAAVRTARVPDDVHSICASRAPLSPGPSSSKSDWSEVVAAGAAAAAAAGGAAKRADVAAVSRAAALPADAEPSRGPSEASASRESRASTSASASVCTAAALSVVKLGKGKGACGWADGVALAAGASVVVALSFCRRFWNQICTCLTPTLSCSASLRRTESVGKRSAWKMVSSSAFASGEGAHLDLLASVWLLMGMVSLWTS